MPLLVTEPTLHSASVTKPALVGGVGRPLMAFFGRLEDKKKWMNDKQVISTSAIF
jgi:hypothetical protein